jgi:hypothetical protein
MVLDEEGLSEVANIQTRALNEIIEAEAKSAGRLTESGETGMNALAAMMCFEMPQPSQGLRRSNTSSEE